jgi:transposase
MDREPRPRVRAEKSARDRLIRLAASRPDWALGFEDEVWWSRTAQPALSTWATDDRPLRLVEQAVARGDKDPKALACYGLLVRWADPAAADGRHEEAWLRFVDGRPISALTAGYLEWCCGRLAERGKRALLLVWDNASWHVSAAVRDWITEHNHAVRRGDAAVRIVSCYLPVKAPWLNPIEPMWAHGKRRIAEPARLLTAAELIDRVCSAFGCAHEPHLAIPATAA